jgi:nucleotide sugar dehydrogenase
MIKTIGIIGQGFVGNSVKEGFNNHFNICTFDLDSSKSTEPTLQSLVNKSDVIFVCLPTPMKRGGECDVSIIENVIEEINNYNKNITVLIKSTIPPGTTERFCNSYWNINIIFNPEFLTEANAVNDYINQTRIILGVAEQNCSHVISMFNKVFPKAKVIKTKSKVAEMVKYVTNCFLSTKVSFANEIYQVCDKLDIDYDKVIEYSKYDDRLGNSHWNVPGPDGSFGYGGHCFPKDIGALKFLANNLGVDTLVLDGIINKNNEVRTNRDWEQQKGRAVSKDYFD